MSSPTRPASGTLVQTSARPTPEERSARYKPGSIRRVRLQNFLTYSDVEFCPGPRLNMVVGANGTGKSSILCAICLGLGGQPPLLGRADDARTFIMHEREVSTIEIELSPQVSSSSSSRPNVHVLKRVIDRNRGSEKGKGAGASTYYINSTKSNLKEVRKLVSEYSISVDNLCTFLPQDRVGSFSGFDSQMLLQETEKSLSGSKHIFDDHMKLIELEQQLRTSGNSVETIGDKLKALEAENERLEREKELMEERAKYERAMDLLEKKRAWLAMNEAWERACEIKAEKGRIKTELKKARASVKPLEERHEKVVSQMKRMKSRFATLESGAKKATTEYDKSVRKAQSHQDAIEADLESLTSLDSLQRRAEKAVTQARAKVEDLEARMADYPPEEEIQKALADAQSEIRSVKTKLEQARRDHGRISAQIKELQEQQASAEGKLEKMNDERARRRERIFRQQPKLLEAFQWVDQNRKMFRRPVWGPVVCEVTPKGQNAAAYLEQHVANSILKAFVVECEEDLNLLYREVRQKRNLPINVVKCPGGRLERIKRMYSDEKMDVLKREHGVIGYLDESFTAPDAILEALCKEANVHQVLVGSARTQDSLDRHGLLDFLGQKENGQPGLLGSCIFTCHMDRSYKYTTQPSRYSGESGTRVDDINPAKWLAQGVNPEHKAALETSIMETRDQIDRLRPELDDAKQKQEDVTAKGQAISQRLKDAKAAKTDLTNFQLKLKTARRKLQECEESASKDNVAEKEALLQKLTRHVESSIKALETAGTRHTDMMKSTYTLAGVKMTEDGLAACARKTKDELAERESETEELNRQWQEVNSALENAKREVQTLKKHAENIAPLKDSNGDELPLKAELEELPTTLNEVEAALEEATTKVNSITDNPEVLRQYEERKKEIEATRQEMEGLSEAQDAKRAHLDKLRAPWEASLKNTLQKVNTLFGEYMKELGCAGEIALTKGQTPNVDSSEGDDQNYVGNFKNWGVEIRVKFREKSALQVLSAQVHSGGERSVSTIMYLMALQELMVSPFRCVDEINQGLDERNERLVFRRIVNNSTREPTVPHNPISHSGQYFLITPKLLPNLTDMENEDLTVLCIFNGPYNFKHFSDWNADKFIESRKRVHRALSGDEGDKENVSERDREGALPRKSKSSRKTKRRISE